MIVDTSALVAVFRREEDYEPIRNALAAESGLIPSVVIVEFFRVLMRKGADLVTASDFLNDLLESGLEAVDFTPGVARAAADANILHGSGNGKGGKLNLLDLMVFAVAEDRRLPILCTGSDFASTGIAVHPASRLAF